MARRRNCEKVYNIFIIFLGNCLIDDRSLLWPDEQIWTPDNLEAIKKNFIENPLVKGEYWEKIDRQFHDLSDSCWKALADAHLIYGLPSNFIKPEKKYELIKTVCDKRNLALADFDDPFWGFLHEGFTRTAMRYHFKYMQLWAIFLIAIRVKQEKDRADFLRDPQKVEASFDQVLESIPSRSDRAWDMRHAFLHMAFPERYESIISTSHKESIVQHYANRIPPEKKSTGLEQKLYLIRQSFEEDEYRDKDFGFYLQDIKRQWWDDRHVSETESGEVDQIIEIDPLLEEMVSLLRRRRQIILYGPPGTGKTYYALKLAREIVALDNYEKSYDELDQRDRSLLQTEKTNKSNGSAAAAADSSAGYLSFCTFHPTFGYEEFIEGYRPKPGRDGTPHFVLQDGLFKKLCQRAAADPSKTYVLIIDEINRGNIPRIFGELITLIEKDKRRKNSGDSGISLTLAASGEIFYVPDNLLIIGTMNTADRSIALLDIALRRRFGFYELMPLYELLDGTVVEGINLGALLRELNRRVSLEVGRNQQIGHSYLMESGKPVKDATGLLNRLKDEILPLLQEYCYDDYHKLANILGHTLVDTEKKLFNMRLFQEKGRERFLELLREICGSDTGARN